MHGLDILEKMNHAGFSSAFCDSKGFLCQTKNVVGDGTVVVPLAICRVWCMPSAYYSELLQRLDCVHMSKILHVWIRKRRR